MNRKTKTVMAILALGIVISCKQTQEEKEAYNENADTASVVSSSGAVEKNDSPKKFIRTADLKFKVKNVAKSTYAIENITTQFGGFVTYTHLQSHINENTETRVSQDSILETTKYTVDNTITIRVPNTKLDTVLKLMAKEIDFLDSRLIKADEVTLQLLANKLAQSRSSATASRIENAIDTKGKKLDAVLTAEENLSDKRKANDDYKLENLSLKDQVNYSTITLELYQREAIKHELYASEKSINKYRPHLGLQIWDSLKTGWFMLESIVAFIVQLWALFLIVFLVWLGYKKLARK